MEIFEIKIGDIVESLQGRDLGCRYLVVGIDKKGYFSLIDGDLKTKDKPKTKNPKHLSYVGSAKNILNKLDKITNCELNKMIKKVNKE